MSINTAPLNELGELMESVRNANDWSYGDIARHTEGIAGVKALSRSNVQRLATDYPLVSITRGAIQGLAAGMRVSPDRVALAAVQAMGFRPPVADMSAAEAVQRDPSLSSDTRRIVLTILRDSSRTA
jgi:hypothetical protein